MATPVNNIRKAAILVASLDGPDAEEILERLTPLQADQVRDAAASLGPVSRAERDIALREFNAATSPKQQETPQTRPPRNEHNPTHNPSLENEREGLGAGANHGVELQGSLSTLLDQYDAGLNSYSSQISPVDVGGDVEADVSRWSSDSCVAPFGFLEQTEPSTLAAVLRKEHPQTVAVVLSSAAPERAAELLAHLPERLQLDVLHRMSELAPGDPESVRVLAGELRAWVQNHRRDERQRERGIATVRSILAATPANKQAHLFSRIQACDAGLAEKLGSEIGRAAEEGDRSAVATDLSAESHESVVREKVGTPERTNQGPVTPRPVEPPDSRLSVPQRSVRSQFDDLAHVGDAVWTRILPMIEPQLLVLALTGEEQSLVNRVASHLTAENARALRQSLESLGPMRLSDVAAARDELVRVANQIASSPPAVPLAA